MKQLCVRALQLLLIFAILGIPCLLSVTGGQQTEIVPMLFQEEDRILEEKQHFRTDELLQFVAGGHVLGFREGDVTIASGDHALRIGFVGAHSVSPEDEGAIQNSDKSENGPKPFDRVIYKDLWQGVSLIYEKHNSGVVKSTYIVQPSGTDNTSSVNLIRLRYNVPVSVAENGNLIFSFETGQMTESSPVAWQEIKGKQIPVEVSFYSRNKQEVGFVVGSYDTQFPLVIDPVLSWHTFMGASVNDYGRAIAVDGSGNVYVAGASNATWGVPMNPHVGDGSHDALAVKLDSSGGRKRHTFMGGAGADQGYAIAVDGSGNVYVAGGSEATWGAPINAYAGGTEAFVIKFSSSNPVPDIKANGSDSTITITQGDALEVTIELDPGELNGEDADWWILKQTSESPPNNWYYFDYPTRSWMLGRSPTRQGGLVSLSSKKVPGTSGLAAGPYTFYFAIDMLMNGTIDVGAAFFDKVKVIIDP